jgi:hypothetical protein
MKIRPWGFFHSTFVTVPVSTIGFIDIELRRQGVMSGDRRDYVARDRKQ